MMGMEQQTDSVRIGQVSACQKSSCYWCGFIAGFVSGLFVALAATLIGIAARGGV